MALVNRSLAFFFFFLSFCNNLEIWDQGQGKGKRKGNFQMKKTLQIHS